MMPMENSEDTPRGPGVYALILEITRDIVVKVGSLGTLKFEKGFYIYIGSARGPGGLRTRLTRHVRGPARIKWHIDYITSRDDVKAIAAVVAETTLDMEETVSSEMIKQKCIKPQIKDFGSSDKRSITHLLTCNCDLLQCIKTTLEAFKSSKLEPKLITYTTSKPSPRM